jgi:glyoxylate/hydroxypyruvate reductase A
VTVTPHIAAETRPQTSSKSIAENIFRSENGLGLLNLVDRVEGY